MPDTSDVKIPKRKHAANQPSPDAAEETDRARTPPENDRMRREDAMSADKKAKLVDKVHGLAR